jgi:hypothetical protein
MGVDRYGGPVIDPTKNVIDKVEDAVKRQDDLREAESRHIREIGKIREEHTLAMMKKESERIDAIRAVDTGNVARAAEASSAAAAALATQLVATAEQNRTQVASAAAAAVTSLSAALEPIQKDIRDLRDAQSRGQGGKDETIDVRAERAGRNQYVGLWIALAAVSVAVIFGAAGIAMTLLLKG